MSENSTSRYPLILGEVLFDRFPGGHRVLGGAPFNVAWNLHSLGEAPTLLSAVGQDEMGEEIQTRMTQQGMDNRGLQVRDGQPTGWVEVSLEGGEPSYEIVPDVAYDFIDYPDFPVDEEHFLLLYHGSLALRSEVTRGTLHRLKTETPVPCFVDLNLRPPWFDHAWLPLIMQSARWFKLNREELAKISGQPCKSIDEIVAATRVIREQYGSREFWVTCGSDGAYSVDAEERVVTGEPGDQSDFVDSVGAGDAFAAIVIMGIRHGWSRQTTMDRAIAFAAAVCGLRGATTDNAQFYRQFHW